MIRLIGEGGMGMVYEAEQVFPRRRVAIKVIRSSFASRRLLRRFAHEAHILGRLHHPGIAQIHEAGAGDRENPDQAFLVMEFVDGPPLTTWCADHSVSVADTLELAAKVGEAVAHAHQRGVIHRDLKPANILVAAGGQPKVLDFGVARVTDGDLELTTQLTSMGQLVGTIPYMSPEQVSGDPAEVDVRSDVYALGVILYELLARRLPHDVSKCSIPAAARIIREDDPPRLGTLVRECRGDVETIVHKALEKEKERRYPSAAEFVADLRRCIAGEPIQAREHSAFSLIRRQLRRYQGAIAAAALLAIALAAFSIYSWQQRTAFAELAADADAARGAAVEAAERADRNARDLEVELGVSRIERGRLFARTSNTRAAEELLWRELFRDPTSALAFFALCELSVQQPCIATWPVGAGVRGFGASRSGDRLAAGLADGAIVVLRAADGEIVGRTAGDGVAIWNLAFLGDGAIVGVDALGRVAVHEPGTLALRWRNRGHDVGRGVAALPDDSIVTSGFDGTVVRWSPEGEVLASAKIRGAGGDITASPDGERLLLACTDGVARLITPRLEIERELPSSSLALASGAFSTDGSIVYFGGVDRTLRAWRVFDGKELAASRRPNGTLRGILVLPGDESLLSCGWWTLDRWTLERRSLESGDLDGLRLAGSYSLPDGAVTLALVDGGTRVASAHIDTGVRIWEVDPRWPRRLLATGKGPSACACSPDGSLIAWADETGRVALHDARSGKHLRDCEAMATRVATLKFSPDSRRLFGVARDGVLRGWQVDDGARSVERAGINGASATAIDFSRDGRHLSVCHRFLKFSVLDSQTLEPIVTVGGERESISTVVAPDGRSFVAVTRDQHVRHWSFDDAPPPAGSGARQATLLGTFEVGAVPWAAAISPDGRTLAIGTWGKTIELFDVQSHARIAVLEGHSALIHDLRFLPDEPDRLLSAGSDGEVRMWDVPTRRSLLTITAASGWEILNADCSPDGRTLVTSSASGEIASWDLRTVERAVASNLAFAVQREGVDPTDPKIEPLVQWARRTIAGEEVPGPWTKGAAP
jgi:WD40 repeat protein/tRNA A-37 threonylcarbamoyl transferase component Bud32